MNLTPAEIFQSSALLMRELEKRFSGKRITILTDENVSRHCLTPLLEQFNDMGETDVVEIEAGEASKNLAICSHLYTHLLENNVSRKDLLVNFGGGVITDLGGFIGATFKRGIDFIHLPTSLMAMTDAAIGGKTGIDHDDVKNAVGSFSSPLGIFVCPEFLKTLPQNELKSGFAEMLKHTLIADADSWNQLIKANDISISLVSAHLFNSIRIKERIVNNDPTEKGERKILNFGHTIGHAIESALLQDNQSITHGEAIALGMMLESRISNRIGVSDQQSSKEIENGISQFFDRNNFQLPASNRLQPFILNDKKNSNGNILFSLVTKPGSCQFNIPVEWSVIEEVYNTFKQEIK